MEFDPLKVMNALAVVTSKQEIIDLVKRAIKRFDDDPTDDNFEMIGVDATIISIKIQQIKQGGGDAVKGFNEVNKDLNNARDAVKVMERLSDKSN